MSTHNPVVRRLASLGAVRSLLPAVVALATFAALAAPAAGQEGLITYDRATRLALELPPEIAERFGDDIPGESFESLVLLFSPTETVMIPGPDVEEAEEAEPAARGTDAFRQQRMRGFMSRMQQFSPERSDQERVMVAHTDLTNGTVIENRTFMGRAFLIEGTRPQIPWRLTGEQSQFAGHMVMKALATVDSTEIEAWFTPQIPVPGGPGEYGGLPGMILSLSIDNGRILYSATSVNMTPVDEGAIRPPTQGEEIERDDYEELVAERLDELRMMRDRRGRRRRPGG